VVIRAEDIWLKFYAEGAREGSLKGTLIRWLTGRGPRDGGAFWALRGVSLAVAPGETVGIIGANGSGKSTLLKVVAGILRPDRGAIQVSGRAIPLLELGVGFSPDLSGRENIFLNAAIMGVGRTETRRYFDAIVAFSELERFLDVPVRHYSSGMYVRLGFAIAVTLPAEILLLDEVLAVGDERFREKSAARLRELQRAGRTIVLVSHDLPQVEAFCRRACLLDQGLVVAEGPCAPVIRRYREAASAASPGALPAPPRA
jgi:ABC-2 type transport system ATP-binding protein